MSKTFTDVIDKNPYIDILGTEWEIEISTEKQNPKLKDSNGICEAYSKKIVLCDFEIDGKTYDNIQEFKNKVLRHEIIHAFMHESGLNGNSEWSQNEECVDWFALQFTKLEKKFRELNIL